MKFNENHSDNGFRRYGTDTKTQCQGHTSRINTITLKCDLDFEHAKLIQRFCTHSH